MEELMRLMILGAIGLLASIPAQAQDVQRYIERTNKVQPVTPDHRLPVSNGPNRDPAAGLNSSEAHAASSAVSFTGPAVFYSILVTLATGEGPGRIMVWDRTSIPADGALTGTNRPIRCIYVDAGDRTTVFSSASGLAMLNGISWAFSTGANCQTITRAAANFVAISYKAPTP